MEQLELEASTREVLGKKVKALRRQGITPAHLFGPDIESLALQMDTARLHQVLARAGSRRLITLKVAGAKKAKNVLIQEIQRDARTGQLLHADFYQPRLTEKIKVEVLLALVGEAPAVKSQGGTLLQTLSTVTVECLPGQIPSAIEVDVSRLEELEDALHVKDIALGEGIKLLTDPEEMVAKVASPAAAEKVVEREEVKAEEE